MPAIYESLFLCQCQSWKYEQMLLRPFLISEMRLSKGDWDALSGLTDLGVGVRKVSLLSTGA